VRLFRKIKDPVEGVAQVSDVSPRDLGVVLQNMEMTLVVQAMGVAPFTLRHKCMCRANKWPSPGMTLPVVFDREHTDRLDVQWDRVPSVDDRLDAQAGAPASPPAGTFVPQPGVQVTQRVIDLRDQPEARDAVLGALEAMMGQDLDGDGRIGRAAGGGAAPDRLGELERLARLRDSGALTEAEFEAEKRRLLGT
jgi:hypothetical protein